MTSERFSTCYPLSDGRMNKSSCLSEMAPGKKCWGTKTVRVPTASEASQSFTDHTFQIGLNATTLSKNISKLRKCRQCTENFKNSSTDGGLSEFSGGSCPQASPVALSLLLVVVSRFAGFWKGLSAENFPYPRGGGSLIKAE